MKARFGIKPACPVLQTGHPLARGLQIAWFGPEDGGSLTRDAARKNHGTTMAGVTWGRSETGSMWTLDSAAAPPYIRSARIFVPTKATVAIRFRVPSLPGVNYSSIGGFYNGLAQTTADRLLLINSSNKLVFYTFSAGPKRAVSTGPSIVAGTWYTAVGTHDGATLVVYQDGIAVGSIACGAPSATYTVPNFFIGCRDSSGTYQGLSQDVDFACVWDRALSAKAVAQFTADPYAIVRPARQAVWKAPSGFNMALFSRARALGGRVR